MTGLSYIFWHRIPFLRILLSLIAGILIQWYIQLPVQPWWYIIMAFLILFISLFFIPVFERFRYAFLSGVAISILFLALGALLTWHRDIRHDPVWFGNYYNKADKILVTVKEPLVEKTNSYKAEASVNALWKNETLKPVKGKIIIYFKKDSLSGQWGYGTQILINRPLQEIKNSGNPGGFDYKRYSLFHDMTHQVYLKPEDFIVLPGKNENWPDNFLNTTRQKVLQIIRTNIRGSQEQGLAEALLIGYKNDLDRNLVQSYTNTGVVHIIAISGLHLGLVYWLMIQLFRLFRNPKYFKWLRPVVIICGLWFFALLTGGQPSVLRSALMFTCIVAGESLFRKGDMLNTLAASAFMLLCWNPYWLWDAGFQLSYAAVSGIVIFFRPLYHCFYFRNKIFDFLWKLCAITITAQVFTLPLSIFHFHQFPNYFLLANIVVVPLSSIILSGEILLCALSLFPLLAAAAGKLLTGLIGLMNGFTEKIEALPYSLWDGLQISILQTVLLVIVIAGIGFWLTEKYKPGLITALFALLGFTSLRAYSLIQARQQKKIIVYNVPRQKAIDFVDGRSYIFNGDTGLLRDDFARNFHLKPSRVFYRMAPADTLPGFWRNGKCITWHSKRMVWLEENSDDNYYYDRTETTAGSGEIDLLVISGNQRLAVLPVIQQFRAKQIVLDGTVPSWKIRQWESACDSLHIPCYDVSKSGAFVMNLR